MSEGAGGGIFMDIMPRLDQSALGSVVNMLTGRMSQLGSESGTKFGAGFNSGVGGASQQMAAQLEKNLQAAQLAVERASAGIKTAQDSQVLAAQRVEAAQLKVNETLAKYGAGTSQAATATVNLTRATQAQEGAATAAAKATQAQVTAALNLEAATRRQTEAADASAVSAGNMSKAWNTAGKVLTVGFVAAVGVAIDKAAEFQTTQTRLVTSAGETASNLKLVSDGLLQMAGQVGYSAQQLSTGMYTIESAGYHGADGLNVMKAAAQGAKMEGAELKTVADAVSTALTDYHMPASDAAKVTSQLVTAVGQGKTTMEEFSASLHSITPLAASAGISLADVTGALAEMTAHGMSADQASQNLADTLRHMMSATGPMRDELAQIGMTSTDLNDSLSSRGLSGTLELLSQKILAAEGPDGKMLLNAFNSSKDAAKNLQEVVSQMPPALQQVTEQFEKGAISSTDYRKAVGALPGNMKDLATGFLSAWDKANGFTTALKNGSPQAQNYTQAIKAITGDATGLNTTLMLTGENADAVTNNIKLISGATQDARGNVKGWDDIQNTFNQKLAEFKASIGASAITLGTDFLPAATSVAGALADVARWLGDNKTYLDALLISIGAAAAAWVTFKTASAMWTVINLGIEASTAAMGLFTVAEEGATVGAGGLAAALAATGISEVVIGVTALVAAIIGLGVGAKYAYDHWSWFKTAVDDTWHVLKAVGEWIGSAFMSTVHALEHAWENVVHAWDNFTHALGNVEHAIGNVEHAVDNVMNVLKIAAAIVVTAVAVPFVVGFKMIESAVLWVYHGVIEPTFHLMETIFHWLVENVIAPIVANIVEQVHLWGEVITWIHDKIIEPTIHAISDVWHWLYDNAIHPVVELIQADIHLWGDVFHWLHDSVIKPVGDAIGSVMTGMKSAFKDVVDWLETQWNRIVGIVAPPVKFIVDTVYNAAIVPVWNDVAGVFGLSKLDPVAVGALGGAGSAAGAPVGHAGGGVWQGPGVLPGYAPGHDSHNAILSPGEGVAVPELVQAIGPSNFMALNYAFSGGRTPGSGPGFDAGGVFNNVVGGVENLGKSVVGDAVGTAKFLAKLAIDPTGAVKDLFSDAIGKTAATQGDPSQWLDMIKSLPGKVVDSVIQKALGWVSGGTPFVGSRDLTGWIAQAISLTGVDPAVWTPRLMTLIGRESAGNPNAVNLTDSNATAGNPSRGLMQTTGTTFQQYRDPSLPDNINDPVANIVAGIRYIKSRYGDITAVQQGDANAAPRGYAGGGIAPGGDRSAIDRALGWAQSLQGHPYNDQGWLDCSGLISGVYDQLLGRPLQRAFTTVSDFSALGFRKGTGGIFDIGVTPKPGMSGHMVASLDGHRIESGGAHNNIAVDGPATGPNDPQFQDHYYLPGSLFSPPWTGTGAKPNATSTSTDKLTADVTKWTTAADKARQLAQTESAAATTHDQQAQAHLAAAAKADALAAASVGAAKQKHIDAAAAARKQADASKAAAQKSRDAAAKHMQEAQDADAKATQAKADAQSVAAQAPLGVGTNNATNSASSNGPVQPMTLHDFGSRLGGIAADAFTETFGLSNTLIADPSKSAFFRIGAALLGAKWGQYPGQPMQTVPGAPNATVPPNQTEYGPGIVTDGSGSPTGTPPGSPGAGTSPNGTSAPFRSPQTGAGPGTRTAQPQPAQPTPSGAPGQLGVTTIVPGPSTGSREPGWGGSPTSSTGGREPGWGGTPGAPTSPTGSREPGYGGSPAAPTSPTGSREPGYGASPSPALSPSGSREPDSNYDTTRYVAPGGQPEWYHQYDSGGWIPAGLGVVNNQTGRPEPVLTPAQLDAIKGIADQGATAPRAYVVIENQHVNNGDGRAVARDIYREMLAYPGAGRR